MTGPVAWIRFCGDGCVEGPILDNVIEEVQRKSGAWTPLYAVPQPAPAIDLEQFREAVEALNAANIAQELAREPGYPSIQFQRTAQKCSDLMALIDGQAGGQSHPDTDRFNFIEGECLAVEAVSVRASEDDADVAWVISQHHMGRGQVVLHRSHDDNLRRAIDAVMQHTKGEGVAGD